MVRDTYDLEPFPTPGEGPPAGPRPGRFAAHPALRFERRVTVERADPRDAGFGSRTLFTLPGSTPFDALQPFIPGLWWRSSRFLPEWAIGGNPGLHAYFAREDRMGAPLVAVFDPASSLGVTLL
jgi:hypothetical protein